MADKISFVNNKFQIPNNPKITFIEGDGIGVDITPVTISILNAAIKKAYKDEKKIEWKEIFAGEKAKQKTGNYLPQETFDAISEYKISLKGPLTTPIGGGFRSLNVTLRQQLELYACIRPVNYIKGVPSPLKEPEKLDITIFRENTEDVYAGVEFEAESFEADFLIDELKKMGKKIAPQSAIGIKPVSQKGSERLIRMAIEYAIEHNKKSVTLVHKGNIMKFTEGYFKKWGYELAEKEFSSKTISEQEVKNGKSAENKIVIKDRIADAMFQQLILRPDEYDVVATLNLNGDYLSDAAAAHVGGLGMAPGGNIGNGIALFEATHGTAPAYAGQNKVNPGSLILSGVMMLEFMGWNEAAKIIKLALEKTILDKKVTYDLARQFENIEPISTSKFGEEIIKCL